MTGRLTLKPHPKAHSKYDAHDMLCNLLKFINNDGYF